RHLVLVVPLQGVHDAGLLLDGRHTRLRPPLVGSLEPRLLLLWCLGHECRDLHSKFGYTYFTTISQRYSRSLRSFASCSSGVATHSGRRWGQQMYPGVWGGTDALPHSPHGIIPPSPGCPRARPCAPARKG